MKDQLTKANIGVAIAGTGFIGHATIEGIRRNGINVMGLAEATPELAQRKAAENNIPRAYDSFEAMLADPDIDVVHLATPNHLHFPQARAALLAGKHVICEKPLAVNSIESAELVRIAAQTGLVNAVNFNLRMYPIVQQARSLVRSGVIGDIFMVHGSYLQDWLLYETDYNWRLEPSVGGNLRVVGDIGSHWLDLVTFVSGQPISEVLADFQIFHKTRKKPTRPIETYSGKALQPSDYVDVPITTEDYASILLHYDNGARGVMTASQLAAGRKNRLYFEINGSKSSLSWDSERPNELWIGHRGSPNQVQIKDPVELSPEALDTASYPGGHTEGYPDTFKQQYKKVYRYIINGDYSAAPDFPTFADGHRGMLLAEAIETSSRESRWVRL